MINIIICDDEKYFLDYYDEIIKDEIDSNISYRIIKFAESEKVLEFANNNLQGKNIFLLDIELKNNTNGLLLAQQIRKMDKYKSEMIFITNHSELVFKAFQYKLRVLEFIDKNYNIRKQLKESIEVAMKILIDNDCRKSIKVSFGSQIFKINTEKIVYVETVKSSKKIVLYTENNRLEFYDTLKNLKYKLGEEFIQSHKTTLVNKSYISCINKDYSDMHICLKNGMTCALSKTGIKEVERIWG